MANFSTIHNAKDYVNYVFNISTRGVMESTAEIIGMSGTIQNVIGNLAFKTSEYLTNAETVSVGFGTAAVAAFSQATKQAIAFEQATASVEAISGKQLSGSDIGAKAMQMSNQFGMATSEMTEGLEALARAGITANDSIMSLLESGVQLSKFEGMDLEDSINSLISTVNLLKPELNTDSAEFGDAVKELNQKIVSTSEASPINAENIMNSLQHIGGYASATGIDQDDLFAVIAQLGAKGTKGEITGTSLRAFVSAGQKDTAQRALDRIGLSVTDLWDESGDTMLSISQMKDVLDEALETKGYSQQEKLEFYSDFVGYKQANQIMKIDTAETAAYKDKIAESLSLTEKMNIILGTVQGNWNQIVNTATNFLTKIGKVMLPIINAILIPIKMIVKIIDAIPFGEYIASFGLGLVAIQGISTAFNTLVPTVITFITKFIQFDKTSFSIKNIFEEIKKTLLDSKQIIQDIMDMKWDKINEITNSRESESTNKVLQERLSKESINEYFRQKYGVGDIYDASGNITGQYYKWDKMSRTEREYIMNKYRPEEAVIEAFTKYRTQAFDARYQGQTIGDTVPPSSRDFPSIDDVEEELRRRQAESQENTEQYVSNINAQLSNLSNQTFNVRITNKDFKSHIIDDNKNFSSSRQTNAPYNNNTSRNTSRNTSVDASDAGIPHVSSPFSFDKTYVPKAATNTTSTWRASDYRNKLPITQANMDYIMDEWFNKGKFTISDENAGRKGFGYTLGTSQSAIGTIKINAPTITAYDGATLETGALNFLGTLFHEISHSVSLNNPVRHSSLDAWTSKDDRGHPSQGSYDPHNFGTELESNYAEAELLRAFGFKAPKLATDRVVAFGSIMNEAGRPGDIDLDYLDKYITHVLRNPYAYINLIDKQINDLDPTSSSFMAGSGYGLAKKQEIAENTKKRWKFVRDQIVQQYECFEDILNTGFSINEDIINSTNNLASQRAYINLAHLHFKLAQDKPVVSEVGPAKAAENLLQEKERFIKKQQEFHDRSNLLKVYRKNFDASVMTDDGFDFAITKNRRVLEHFLATGENKGFMKNQFDYIMQHMASMPPFRGLSYIGGRRSDDVTADIIHDLGNSADMAEFMQKYANLKDAGKVAVREIFLQYGKEAAEHRLNTKGQEEVNWQRKNLITQDDYDNIADIFGIDFSLPDGNSATKAQKFAILQDWLKHAGRGRENEIAQTLMSAHENELARTMESVSTQENIDFIQYLATHSLISEDLKSQLLGTNQNDETILKGGKFHAFNVLNNNLDDAAQQKVYKTAEAFFGGFAEFGQSAMYELGLHLQEMKLLADRAGVRIEDIEAMPDLPKMTGMPGNMPIPIPVTVINMPDFPGVPPQVHVTPIGSDGNPIPPKSPIPTTGDDYGPQEPPIVGPSGTEATRGHEDVVKN